MARVSTHVSPEQELAMQLARRAEDAQARELARLMKRYRMCHCGHHESGHKLGEGCTFVIPRGAVSTDLASGEHACPCTEGRWPREDDAGDD